MKALVKPANDDLSRDIRRYQVRLKVTATGVLLFAFWNIVKAVLISLLSSDESTTIADDIKSEMTESPEFESMAVFIIILAVFLFAIFLDTWLRIYIYRMAKRESGDPSVKRKKSYIVMAILLICTSVWSIYAVGMSTYKGEYDFWDGLVTIIIEFSSMVAMIELIQSVVMLRKLRDRKIEIEEAAHE